MRNLSLWLLWSAVAVYTGCRLALLPVSDIDRGGFMHDSAYIALVAENVQNGRGYVNDAHWLVFLRPHSLPVPYHNANPLYPALIAAVSSLTGASIVTSGFAVSALASGLLFAALLVLTGRYVQSTGRRFLLALGGTVFTPVFQWSLAFVPDALCLVLAVAFLACLVRSTAWWSAALGGLFLGLSWLTRSSAILVLPAAAVFLMMDSGWRKCLRTGLIAGGVALATISPWLVHTATVWGSPLRSDASYYLLQDYHARSFDDSVERFWHSTSEPPSLGQILQSEPGAFLYFWARNIPLALHTIGTGWSYGSWFLGIALLMCTSISVCRLVSAKGNDRRPYLAEIAAIMTYAATTVLVFGIRARSLETRYLVLVAVFLGVLLMEGLLSALTGLWSSGRFTRLAQGVVVAAGILLWSGMFYQDFELYESYTGSDKGRQAYHALAREVHREFGSSAPMVAGHYPYLYTIATGAPSLSCPQSDDAFLVDYMKQYHARYVFLTRYELDFWRPHWRDPSSRPPQFTLVRDMGAAVVFERTD